MPYAVFFVVLWAARQKFVHGAARGDIRNGLEMDIGQRGLPSLLSYLGAEAHDAHTPRRSVHLKTFEECACFEAVITPLALWSMWEDPVIRQCLDENRLYVSLRGSTAALVVRRLLGS